MFAISDSDINVDQLMHEIRETVAQRGGLKTLQMLQTFPGDVGALQECLPYPEATRLALQPAFHPHAGDQYHVNDLLKYHGVDFIQNAYRAILKREPDELGLRTLLEKLASGRLNKIDVLAILALSPEGRQAGVRVEGLKWPARLRKMYRLPVLGYWIENAVALARMPVLHQNFRQLELHQAAKQQLIADQLFHSQQQTQQIASWLSALASAVQQAAAGQQEKLDALKEDHLGLVTKHAQLANEMRESFRNSVEQVEALHVAFADDVNALSHRLDEESEKLAENINQLKTSLQQSAEQIVRLKRELTAQERRALALLDRLDNEADSRPAAPVIAEESVHALDALYADFEDQFRGERQEIKERLRVYLPFVKEAHITGDVLDLGCGRGEWLELMKDEGIEARGVDLNRIAVARSRALGFSVEEGDALAYLRGLPDGSVKTITSFHMVEHLQFEKLIKLVDECIRVLAPGGLLILETPNPENFMVGSHTFYTDPTHRNPIPSETLKFLVQSRGMSRSEILKLRPWDEARIEGDSEIIRRFNEYFYGAPDYAVVAWKD